MENKERHKQLLAVVAFARANGFQKAEIAYWDPENVENGTTDIDETLEDHDPGVHAIGVGVYLNEEVSYTVHPSPDEDLDDTFERVSVHEGDAP